MNKVLNDNDNNKVTFVRYVKYLSYRIVSYRYRIPFLFTIHKSRTRTRGEREGGRRKEEGEKDKRTRLQARGNREFQRKGRKEERNHSWLYSFGHVRRGWLMLA